MYIDADLSITFNFDVEGKKRIEEAIETIAMINNKIGNVGTCCDDEQENLSNAKSILKTILEKKTLT